MKAYIPRPDLEARLLRAIDAGTKATVLVGPRGSGKTTLLKRLQSRVGDSRPTAFIQMEPIAASPEILCERFLELAGGALSPGSYRSAPFQRLLAAVSKGKPEALLLLDELTEVRTLSYFPGVERPLESFLETLGRKQAPRSVVTSRFPVWIASCWNGLSSAARSRLDVVLLPPLRTEELGAHGLNGGEILVAATGGLPVHLAPLIERLGKGDELTTALVAEIGCDGRLEAECRATLGQLLHRARGYGACKAVLHVLAQEEGLRLSEVARRLERTPGSARDYLRWLEEVDLIAARDKRFYFVDPVLRLWLRLYGQGALPSRSDIEAEVERHLGRKLPAAPSPEAVSIAPEDEEAPPPTEDLIEID
jgi:energy-coupling factor transporter ATP-binding protein EcfA2